METDKGTEDYVLEMSFNYKKTIDEQNTIIDEQKALIYELKKVTKDNIFKQIGRSLSPKTKQKYLEAYLKLT